MHHTLNKRMTTEASSLSLLSKDTLESATSQMQTQGYCLLRGYPTDLHQFSALLHRICQRVTFDPARNRSENAVQKVDAGTGAIGLHIENGNTPRIPQVVAFYCAGAARTGSQTTLCDGVQLLSKLDKPLQARLQQPIQVQRTLPEALWKAYLANEHPALSSPCQVTQQHLAEMLRAIPGQLATLQADGSLGYCVTINPIMTSALGGKSAFANALLGPSFNYEPPRYTFADGSPVDEDLKSSVAALAEQYTAEIAWQHGDIVIIDNHRVMHGRRAITDAARRELYIGMGDMQ